MATSNIYENVAPCKTCRCGDGDTNIWTTRTSDNPDKQVQKCPNCQVLKSGPLFLSSRGIGWTSWKKRWFILTRTSLVFYRIDPNATLQKGSEANLALGGIDLNNSGSVVVKADKKLLTVFFPDGRDGKTFTLKAETPEDLHEWKTALENALAVAPSPASALGQNGTSHSDVPDSLEASFEQWRDRRPSKSSVVGRPILLALEDIDGSPSFLEKALRFIEEYGIKVEGILRQAADVEEVERRVREYEQGIVEFTPDEDAHVVGDCIKHILRELPSSPVPATCCTALVEAYKTDRGSRITAMRAAVAETFPEPNRRLVQRILKMMRTVASHKSENRMTLSAVAACMAPLLLRPLLAGDCELEDDFNMGGDGSMQLLQAAAAANHAQAIVIILLEEYERIFDEDSLSSDIYSESEEGDVDDDELTDSYLDDDDHNGSDHALEADIEDDQEGSFSGTLSECNSDLGSDLNKASDDQDSYSSSLENEDVESTKTLSNTMPTPLLQKPSMDISISIPVGVQENDIPKSENRKSFVDFNCEPNKSNDPLPSIKRRTVWGRTSARKNLSMESIDFPSEDEISIQRLEVAKTELQTKIAKEIKGNEILQASLEKRKELLHERRLDLEQDVKRLEGQLQKEIELRTCLEAGLMNLQPGQLQNKSSIDCKTRADLEELALAEADIENLKQKVTDLCRQLSYQLQHSSSSLCESCSQQLYTMYQSAKQNSSTETGEKEHALENSNISMGSISASRVDLHDAPANMSASRDKNPDMHAASCDNVTTQNQGNPYSPESHYQQTLQSKTINQGSKSSGPNNISSSEEPVVSGCDTTSKKSSFRGEALKMECASQRSMVSVGLSSASCAEEPTTCHNSASKRSSSKDKNSMIGAHCENEKAQNKDSPSSPDQHSPQKLQPNTINQTGTRSSRPNLVSSIEEPTVFLRSTASKKSSFKGETVKKENPDRQSLTSRQNSQKQQPNTRHQKSMKSGSSNFPLSEETSLNAASKRFSVRSEETAAAASALTRLTSRLNFLKERRVQLANELQNLDASHIVGPDGPPRTSSR